MSVPSQRKPLSNRQLCLSLGQRGDLRGTICSGSVKTVDTTCVTHFWLEVRHAKT